MHSVREWRTTVFIANTQYNKYIVKYILYIIKYIHNKKIHLKQYNPNNIYKKYTLQKKLNHIYFTIQNIIQKYYILQIL